MKTKRNREKMEIQPYKAVFIPLFFVILGFVSWLVYKGYHNNVNVNVNWDVGDIITGLMLGLAGLIAALAYAFGRRER